MSVLCQTQTSNNKAHSDAQRKSRPEAALKFDPDQTAINVGFDLRGGDASSKRLLQRGIDRAKLGV